MNTQALLMMALTVLVITGVTAYFFWRVLTTAPLDTPDTDEIEYPHGG